MNSRWPIRLRVAFGAAAMACVATALFALAVYAHMRLELLEEADLEIAAYADRIDGLGEGEPGSFSVVHPRVVLVWPASATFETEPDPRSRAAMAGAPANREGGKAPSTWRTAEGGWRGRWATGPGGQCLIAYELDEVDDILRELWAVNLVAGLLLAAVAAVVGWWWSGKVLQPVLVLSQVAKEIHAGALDRRLPLPLARDEIRHLAEVLNGMMERIDQGFQQARRFTADASHELRTPLTIMRGELDRLLQAGQLTADQEGRILHLQEATARLQRLVENLLLLARLDATVAPKQAASKVDFSALVREACEDGAILAEAFGLTLEVEIASGVEAVGEADHLRRVVLILLDNATRYNRPEGRVRCRLEAAPGCCVLVVGNTGPGIASALRERVFQRFMRGDPARVAGGHGLGLALAYEMIRAQGGTLRLVEPAVDDWTEFEVRLG